MRMGGVKQLKNCWKKIQVYVHIQAVENCQKPDVHVSYVGMLIAYVLS